MKSFYFLLITCIYTLSLQAQDHVIFQDLELKRTEDKSLVYKTFSGKATLAMDTKKVRLIDVETGAGKVVMRPSKNSRLIAEAEIFVSAKSLNSAYETLDEHLDLSLNKDGDEVFLRSIFDYEENDGREPLGFFSAPVRKVDLTIYVPENVAIDWNDRSGELIVDGIKNDLVLKDASGGIEIRDMVGNLELVDHSGEISIVDVNRGVSGKYNIDVVDYSGGLELRNVTGKTTIKDTSGGINVDDLIGDLEVKDASGEIDINRVEGFLVIDDTSGGIEVTRLDGTVEVSDTSGGIYINQVSEDVYVKRDGSGGLTVRNIKGELKGYVRRVD